MKYEYVQQHHGFFYLRRGKQRCTLGHVMSYIIIKQCTLTFHHLCNKPHVIGDSVLLLRNFRKPEKSPVILCPTRESNSRPLAWQSHLRPLD
ncbi:hypothetical protein SFRURICE_006925 [Spodoptera frugiperda]|nr:hypothetical protein SFRURICE_006925 [Spodoptera frugiperda]